MTAKVTLVCGVQGSGKSWVCRQLAGQYRYVAHDRCWSHPTAAPGGSDLDAAWGPPGSKSTHLETLVAAARADDKPVVTEVPFDERQLRDRLALAGVQTEVAFVVEDAGVIARRYRLREGKEIPKGALTRAAGLKARAILWGCFAGSSSAVLAHLKSARV